MSRHSPTRVGIESREGPRGERHRAYTREGRRKVYGPWRASLAQARSDRVLMQARQKAGLYRHQPTVREAWNEWIALAENGDVWTRSGDRYKETTLRGYRYAADNFILPELGDVPVTELRRPRIQSLVIDVAALHTGQTARNVATPLCALYRHLLATNDDLVDPTVGLQLPRGSQPRQRVVTPDELAALLGRLPERDRCPLALAALAGLRRSEIQRLRVEDVLLDDGLIVVRDSKTAAGVREVPIAGPLRPILEFQLSTLGDEPTLLYPGTGRWGERIGAGKPFSPEAYMTRCREAWAEEPALQPLGLHEGRHSFASWLVLAGYDVESVRQWIGHSHASTTLDRYVKPLRDRGVRPEVVNAYLGEL